MTCTLPTRCSTPAGEALRLCALTSERRIGKCDGVGLCGVPGRWAALYVYMCLYILTELLVPYQRLVSAQRF